MGFCVLKRIQENWRGCVDQKCKKWLEGGRKSLAVRELSNSVYFAHQEDGWGWGGCSQHMHGVTKRKCQALTGSSVQQKAGEDSTCVS